MKRQSGFLWSETAQKQIKPDAYCFSGNKIVAFFKEKD